jgi:hypothetical protein
LPELQQGLGKRPITSLVISVKPSHQLKGECRLLELPLCHGDQAQPIMGLDLHRILLEYLPQQVACLVQTACRHEEFGIGQGYRRIDRRLLQEPPADLHRLLIASGGRHHLCERLMSLPSRGFKANHLFKTPHRFVP